MTKKECFGIRKLNRHIIVDDESKRCLCGVYGDVTISCQAIINEIVGMECALPFTREVIATLTQER